MIYKKEKPILDSHLEWVFYFLAQNTEGGLLKFRLKMKNIE